MDKDCGTYKINSLAPKRLLKTQFFERKAILPIKKGQRYFALSSTKNEKEELIGVQKDRLTTFLQVMRSFLQEIKSR